MDQSGTALEYLKVAIAQHRDLAKGLAIEMIGFPAFEGYGADGIVKTCLFACPSKPQITNKASGLPAPNQASK